MNFVIKNNRLFTALLAVAVATAGCNKGPDIKSYEYPAPQPGAIVPASSYPSAVVAINGSSFGDYKDVVKVYFNGVLADSVLTCEDNKITVRVPATVQSGKVSLKIWNKSVDSVGYFTVLAPPTISTLNPSSALWGDHMEINGTGFGTDISKVKVYFKGAEATVTAVTDNMITTTVPVGTVSGDVTVTVNDFPVTGPAYAMLVGVPTPIFELDFEDNLVDNISGAPATFTQGPAVGSTLPSYQNGMSGRCIVLAGVNPTTVGNAWVPNQAIVVPNAIMKQKEFTVACWVNWASARNSFQDPIFEFGEGRGTRIAFLARMGGTSWNGTAGKMVGRYLLEKKVKDGTGTLVNYEDYFSGNLLTPGTWKHVAFTFSFTDLKMKIYENGVFVSEKGFSRADVDPFLMNINRAHIACPSYGSGSEPSFGGMIDKFQIFNTVLSEPQIYTLYFRK